MPKRVTRRRQSGRYHNFSAARNGAERRGAERSSAAGSLPCQGGGGGLHSASVKPLTSPLSSPSDVFTALSLHLPVRITAYFVFLNFF